MCKTCPRTYLIISVFLLTLSSTSLAAKIIYVDDDATGANDGSSWQNAYNFLQDALTEANSSAKPVQIRVAQGVYTPDSSSAVADGTGDREATFQLINGVSLMGGYAAFSEADPNVRDLDLYETTLSGDLNADDVQVADPCALPDEPTRRENSHHVVTGSEADITAIIEGFTIAGGHANGPFSLHVSGAGMYNVSGNPTVADCTFIGNSAGRKRYVGGGGGMYNSHSSPTLTNCTFSRNSAEDSGGGMYNHWRSSPNLNNCTFSGNNARSGGGMYNEDESSPKLANCRFSGNSAEKGGGMYNYKSTTTVIDCTFVGNLALGDWGGEGGGIYNCGSGPTLINCKFSGNNASSNGGAMVDIGYYESTMLTECMFTGNAAGYGGAIWIDEQSSILENCTFSGNIAQRDGGAIYGWDASVMTLTNCILWANSPTEVETSPYHNCPVIS